MALGSLTGDFPNTPRKPSQRKEHRHYWRRNRNRSMCCPCLRYCRVYEDRNLGRRPTKLFETALAIQTAIPGTEVLILSTDITDTASVNIEFAKILKTFGRVVVLVNNTAAVSSFALHCNF
ncbi:hypothetical protein N431DRAFT_447675 [Stipitochalara longipes BDJ]|nr:hypothetical protein N431DRAFT_447675 [Stipitochalara longipes BDJ]